MSEDMAGLIAVLIWTVLIVGVVVLNRLINGKNGATRSTASNRRTGPAWEQDRPYPECFEEAQDDDL